MVNCTISITGRQKINKFALLSEFVMCSICKLAYFSFFFFFLKSIFSFSTCISISVEQIKRKRPFSTSFFTYFMSTKLFSAQFCNGKKLHIIFHYSIYFLTQVNLKNSHSIKLFQGKDKIFFFYY